MPPVPIDHEIDVVTRREGLERTGTPNAVRAGRKVGCGQGGIVAECDGGGPEPGRLLGQASDVRTGRERHDPEGVRVRGQHLDRLSPDRSGGPDQRDAQRLGGLGPPVRRGRRRHRA